MPHIKFNDINVIVVAEIVVGYMLHRFYILIYKIFLLDKYPKRRRMFWQFEMMVKWIGL